MANKNGTVLAMLVVGLPGRRNPGPTSAIVGFKLQKPQPLNIIIPYV